MLNIETDAALRGLGRAAYRAEKCASEAIPFARSALKRDLDGRERMLVLAGWRSERTDYIYG